MVASNRVFSTLNTKTGAIKWYFRSRGGDIGPFETKVQAMKFLKDFVHNCVQQGDTGGRGKANQFLEPQLNVKNFIRYELGARNSRS